MSRGTEQQCDSSEHGLKKKVISSRHKNFAFQDKSKSIFESPKFITVIFKAKWAVGPDLGARVPALVGITVLWSWSNNLIP